MRRMPTQLPKGARVYLPDEERRFYGAREEDLAAGNISLAWQHALGAACRRTRDLFDAGRPLCDVLRGRLRYELRATWLGGMHLLDAETRAKSIADIPQALGARIRQLALDHFPLGAALVQAVTARLEPAQRLLQALRE